MSLLRASSIPWYLQTCLAAEGRTCNHASLCFCVHLMSHLEQKWSGGSKMSNIHSDSELVRRHLFKAKAMFYGYGADRCSFWYRNGQKSPCVCGGVALRVRRFVLYSRWLHLRLFCSARSEVFCALADPPPPRPPPSCHFTHPASFLLQNPHDGKLPRFNKCERANAQGVSNLIHDTNKKVRVAFVQLLGLVKGIRSMHYYNVVKIDHILARLSEDHHK